MKTFCYALDLKDDPQLIQAYEEHHRTFGQKLFKYSGGSIIELKIYRVANRLFMWMQTEDTFSFDKKQQIDNANSKVQEWKNLMRTYQQALPIAKPNEKWLLMQEIFSL